MNKRVLITGCSGGGKSTLLSALRERGFTTVEEPGRRIVEAALSSGSTTLLPWVDPEAFLLRALALAREDLARYPDPPDWVFFDRGIIDAASALAQMRRRPLLDWFADVPDYFSTVFFAPPWPEIYAQDAARAHSLEQALDESRRLRHDLPTLGYRLVELPKTAVDSRVTFVLRELGSDKR